MKIDWVGVLMLAAAVAFAAMCIAFDRWYFNAIVAAEWPDWIKWILLRGRG